ncbi:MAG: D-tyrosyl-tRNA(Tyr) deacylase [Flavobacteriales bacterium]|jgi:D-tyrosyl-tRNA(Tyr) deacylase
MRVVLQRVSQASVSIENKIHGKIDQGYLLLVGIESRDTSADIEWMSRKIMSLRVFSDDEGKMNLDIGQVQGSILVISQFTLHAQIKKGTRPSFIRAAHPDQAIPLYTSFIDKLTDLSSTKIETGIFGADMQVNLINDGPVTIMLDTHNKE